MSPPPIEVAVKLNPKAAALSAREESPEKLAKPCTLAINMTWGQRKKFRDEAKKLGLSTSVHVTNLFNEALKKA